MLLFDDVLFFKMCFLYCDHSSSIFGSPIIVTECVNLEFGMGEKMILSSYFNNDKLTPMIMDYTHFIIQSGLILHFQNGRENFVTYLGILGFGLALVVV